MNQNLNQLIEKAQSWREKKGYIGRGGVIVVFDGEVQGWCEELCDPHHWRPGCIAIDEKGNRWQTVDGNFQSGAKSWKPYPA